METRDIRQIAGSMGKQRGRVINTYARGKQQSRGLLKKLFSGALRESGAKKKR